MYPKMGNQFWRENVVVKVPASDQVTFNRTTGVVNYTNISTDGLLSEGDEVIVYTDANPMVNNRRYWVTSDQTSTFGAYNHPYNYVLVDAGGTILNTATSGGALGPGDDAYIKVVRPIERNHLSASAGNITAMQIPALSGNAFNLTQKVISANAQTYCSGWNAYQKNSNSSQVNSCFYPGFGTPPATATYYNPYTAGYYGNWRPSIAYTYSDHRAYPGVQRSVKQDGFFDNFLNFWRYRSGTNDWAECDDRFQSPDGVGTTNTADRFWTAVSRNTVYSPYGNLMEHIDIMGIYHAQRYGFNQTAPVLSASNAKAREVGFESFEDYRHYYDAINACGIVANDQLDFYNQLSFNSGTSKPHLSTTAAHTGLTSLKFMASQNVALTHNINQPHDLYMIVIGTIFNDPQRRICSEDPIMNRLSFDVSTGKFITSFWIKSSAPAMDYSSDFTFAIETKNGGGAFITLPPAAIKKSGIINGWQKFDYEFKLGGTYAANSEIRFKLNAIHELHLDDFRVQPYNSNMVCTVYDPYQMRPCAQLDDRNYATIMEYDNEGMLVRKKKETLKGIYTLEETRSSTIKRN
jgi:hypothetical protein